MDQKSFWGLVIEQEKEYKITPTFNFHVSRAVLDLSNSDGKSDGKPVSVKVQVEDGKSFILCNLSEKESQANLDLIFSEGEKIKFFTTGGKATIHLTGYLMPEEDFSQFDDEFSDDDSVDELVKNANQAKRKNTETLKLTGKDAKKLKGNDGKAVENNAKNQQKIVDVDPKQVLGKNDKKQKNQVNNLATKKQVEDSDDSDLNDDDLSIDEDEESVDLNAMMDEDSELDDEDLESNDDLESDDDEVDDLNMAKLNGVKNQMNKPNAQGKKQQNFQKNKNQNGKQNKPNQQKPKNDFLGKLPQKPKNDFLVKLPEKPKDTFAKSPQNKTPQQKNQNKPHQQTPFHHNRNSNKKNQGTPFQSGNKNKSFGSQNKQAKKVFN